MPEILLRIIQGSAALSTQIHAPPHDLPVIGALRRALDRGITATGISPYYEPAEVVLGEALRHPEITSNYPRHTYFVATKARELHSTVLKIWFDIS